MKTQPLFRILAIAILLAGLATGYLQAAEPVTLEFWHPYGPPWDAGIERAAESFMKDHPNIKVNVKSVPDLHQKLPVAVAAGVGPDVAHVWGVANVIGFSDGVLEPLDKYLDRIPEWNPDDVFPGFLEAMRFNGQIWAMPVAAQPTSLAYSRDLFASAGVPEIHESLDEHQLMTYVRKLTSRSGDGTLQNVGFLPDMWGGLFNWTYHWGGNYYNEATGKVTADDDANVAALSWISDLYDFYGGKELVDQWRQQFSGSKNNPIYLGRQGMAMFSHYHYYFAHVNVPDWDYGFAPPPQMGNPEWGPKGLVTHTDAHVVVKGTKHPLEATMLALDSTLGDGFTASWLTMSGHPSASISLNRKAMEEDLVPAWYPPDLWLQNFDVLQKARPWPEIPKLNALTSAVNGTLNRVLNKEVAPRAALEEVSRTVQATVDEALGRTKESVPGKGIKVGGRRRRNVSSAAHLCITGAQTDSIAIEDAETEGTNTGQRWRNRDEQTTQDRPGGKEGGKHNGRLRRHGRRQRHGLLRY